MVDTCRHVDMVLGVLDGDSGGSGGAAVLSCLQVSGGSGALVVS